MGKLSIGRVFDSFCLASGCSTTCLCTRDCEAEDDSEGKPLVPTEMSLKDAISGSPQTLAFMLKPKTVVLRVSMHCNGCARKVEKHIAKINGVTSYQIDLETKMVVVIGDILPFEVLQSVSKVKFAELWTSPPHPADEKLENK